MDFGILGPLLVSRNGREVPIGAAKQRALLTLLLLRRSEIVSTEAVIDVRGGVRVHEGGTFILGSEELGADTGKIRGGIRAKAPATLEVHFAHIKGGVRMRGGSGFFSTVEDNVIRGGATINGYTGFWLGFIRNNVRGTVKLSNNVMDDPDANEYVTNTIHGSLICHDNSPAPQVGDSEGQPNIVSGRKIGQCAGL